MLDRIPRRLHISFTKSVPSTDDSVEVTTPPAPDEVDFVAYGADCILSGRTVLDDDRLTDMLNSHDEYSLSDVLVERFDGGLPITIPEIVVPRDELWLVHATGPRGTLERRRRTAQQHVAVKMGPYNVRGFYHGLPGTDPALAISRRKPMVPLTRARIEYTIGGQAREELVDAVIINRYQVEWIEAVEPDRLAFPAGPTRPAPTPPAATATEPATTVPAATAGAPAGTPVAAHRT
jgi:hypothetical protein